jgi:RNA polymerase-binding transcription factor DksA
VDGIRAIGRIWGDAHSNDLSDAWGGIRLQALALDAVQLAGEREFAIRNPDRDSNMLRQIRGALVRIGDGSYGVCQRCEEDISTKRIQALPWAAFCISCQEQVDAHEIPAFDTVNPFTAVV